MLLAYGSMFSILMLMGQVYSRTIIIKIIFLCLFLFFPFLLLLCFLYFFTATLLLVMKPIGTPLKEIFKETWRNYWNCLIVGALTLIFTFLGFSLLIIPGIIISIFLSFSLYVCLDEKRKGMDAIKRSWNLVKGSWWQIFGRILLLSILMNLVFLGINKINQDVLSLYLFISVLSLSLPFYFIYMNLIYLDLKKSKEIQTAVPLIKEKVSI